MATAAVRVPVRVLSPPIGRISHAGGTHRRGCMLPVNSWCEHAGRPGASRGPHHVGAEDESITELAALW